MKKVIIILFLLGLFLELCGFALEQVERIPWVIDVIASEYVLGMQGIKRLGGEESLMPNDIGFSEISDIIMLELRKYNSPERISRVAVQKMELVARADIKVGGKSILGGDRNVHITFTNGQETFYFINYLQTKLNDARSTRLFNIACCIFGSGVILQLCGFWLNVVKGKKFS